MDKGELTNYLDVEIEFVIRSIWHDLLPFLYSFYSVGELCRYTLKYYLFNNETMLSDIEKYLDSATESERNHYNEYYKKTRNYRRGIRQADKRKQIKASGRF